MYRGQIARQWHMDAEVSGLSGERIQCSGIGEIGAHRRGDQTNEYPQSGYFKAH
jgi:hypothetical protein